jgi:hypothetical protein
VKLSRCVRQAVLLVGVLLVSTPVVAQGRPDAPGLRGAGAWARVPAKVEQAPALPEPETDDAPSLRFLPVSAEPWSYVPAPDVGHCLQTYRLFLPPAPHTKPANGWPVVVQVKLSGFRQTPDTPYIDDTSFLGDLLRAGIAVVVARVTPSIDTDDPLWSRTCDGVLPDIPGHGLFHPPKSIPPDLAAQGIAPYADIAYDMAEKDAVMLLQHVRFSARQIAAPDRGTGSDRKGRELAMADLDHRLIGVHGVSAGGMALMWSSVGPDRRDEAPFAGRTGQWAETSRPDIAAFERAAVWWPAFHASVRPPTPHFGMYGHSTIPAQTIGACSIEDLIAASPLAFGDAEWLSDLPLYLSYDEPSLSSSYEPEPGGCAPLPFCYPDQGLEGLGMQGLVNANGRRVGMHPAWSGFAWKTRYPNAHLAITDATAYAQRGDVDAAPLFGGLGQRYLGKRDLAGWFVRQFDERRLALIDLDGQKQHAWRDVGYGLGGSRGVPRLSGAVRETDTGSMAGTRTVTLTLTGALEHADVLIIGGPGERHATLAGGILVPLPAVIELGHRADAAGGLVIDLPWPAADESAAGDSPDLFQMMIADRGARRGYAFTNALALLPQADDGRALEGMGESAAAGPDESVRHVHR